MTGASIQRLAEWRNVVSSGQPYWLVELAPYIIRQLEAEVAAQVDRNPEGEKPQALSAKHESPVAKRCAKTQSPISGGG